MSQLLCVSVPLFCLTPTSIALDVGDKAPPLEIAAWIKGSPVNLADGHGKYVYVVEFWATWCGPCRYTIPHLTEMQAKYRDRGVVFVGVSDEPADTVRKFVADQGDKMNYTVACDADRKTTEAYMAAAGIQGIPYAFIIDRDGNVVWHAHPLDDLEQVLGAVLAGTFDRQAAKETRDKLRGLWAKLDELLMSEQSDAALAVNEEINKLKPDPAMYNLTRFRCLSAAGDRSGALSAGRVFLKATDDPMFLNEVSWDLLTNEIYGGRYNELALAIAEKAYAATKGQDWSIDDTYARAKFENGDAAGAVALERKAIDLAKGERPEIVEELTKALDRYTEGAAHPTP